MIQIHELNAQEIDPLNQKDTLYVLDFRSLAESPDYEIPSMWKYENLLQWITTKGTITVNEHIEGQISNLNHTLLILPTTSSARVSVGKRLLEANPTLDGIRYLWTPIPHPDIDSFAQQMGLPLNYSYLQFARYNNKIAQKTAMKTLTPEWKLVHSWNEVEAEAERSDFFLKRGIGAGGFTVFTLEDILHNDKAQRLYEEDPSQWYIERAVSGKPMSVQAYKAGSKIILFGIAEQIIAERKEFTGGKLLPLKNLKGPLYNGISQTIEYLSDLLKEYEGFFGLDFMYDWRSGAFNFLEANVRLTAMSIPTLLKNGIGAEYAEFHEDAEQRLEGDIVLTHDTHYKTTDLLRLSSTI